MPTPIPTKAGGTQTVKNYDSAKIQGLLFWLVLFFAVLLFFTRLHPLIVYDTDDWTYLTYTRDAVPLPGAWNPSRVFPEVFMPLCASLAGYILYPLTQNYILSLAWVFGLVLSGLILWYFYSFYRLLRAKAGATRVQALPVTLLFVLFHWLAMRSQWAGNEYLFRTVDATCCFYYTIPALLNLSLVLLLAAQPEQSLRKSPFTLRQGLLVLGLYLAIFSNLYASYILAVWAGVKLLWAVQDKCRSGQKLPIKTFVAQNTVPLGILAAWLASALLELTGGRSGRANADSYGGAVVDALHSLLQVGHQVNRLFLGIALVSLAVLIFAFVQSLRKNTPELAGLRRGLLQGALGLALMLAYLVLLSAWIAPAYMQRMDVLLGVFAVIFWAVCRAVLLLLQKHSGTMLFLPVLCCICFCGINTGGYTFRDSNAGNLEWQKAYAVSAYCVEQLRQADAAGQTALTLPVPETGAGDNWPLADYGGSVISQALHKHNVISRYIEVTLVPDSQLNEQLMLS